jgi:hypothetical protein
VITVTARVLRWGTVKRTGWLKVKDAEHDEVGRKQGREGGGRLCRLPWMRVRTLHFIANKSENLPETMRGKLLYNLHFKRAKRLL